MFYVLCIELMYKSGFFLIKGNFWFERGI